MRCKSVSCHNKPMQWGEYSLNYCIHCVSKKLREIGTVLAKNSIHSKCSLEKSVPTRQGKNRANQCKMLVERIVPTRFVRGEV